MLVLVAVLSGILCSISREVGLQGSGSRRAGFAAPARARPRLHMALALATSQSGSCPQTVSCWVAKALGVAQAWPTSPAIPARASLSCSDAELCPASAGSDSSRRAGWWIRCGRRGCAFCTACCCVASALRTFFSVLLLPPLSDGFHVVDNVELDCRRPRRAKYKGLSSASISRGADGLVVGANGEAMFDGSVVGESYAPDDEVSAELMCSPITTDVRPSHCGRRHSETSLFLLSLLSLLSLVPLLPLLPPLPLLPLLPLLNLFLPRRGVTDVNHTCKTALFDNFGEWTKACGGESRMVTALSEILW